MRGREEGERVREEGRDFSNIMLLVTYTEQLVAATFIPSNLGWQQGAQNKSVFYSEQLVAGLQQHSNFPCNTRQHVADNYVVASNVLPSV